MTEEAAAESKRPHRAEALVSFDGVPGRERFEDVLVYPKGLLLRTGELKPVGTLVDFDVQIAGEAAALRGRGMVVFSRAQDQGPRRPAGLGLRIEETDSAGQALLDRLFAAPAQIELAAAAPPPPVRLVPPAPPLPSLQSFPPLPEMSRLEVPLVPLSDAAAGAGDAVGSVPAGGSFVPSEPVPRSWSAGGWNAPPVASAGPAEASEEAKQILATSTVSRRWLEAPPTPPLEANSPGSGAGEPAPSRAVPVAAAWVEPLHESGSFSVEPPMMASVTRGGHRARLLPWVLVGVVLAVAGGGAYWAYQRYVAGPAVSAPGGGLSGRESEPVEPQGSTATTLVDDVSRPGAPSVAPSGTAPGEQVGPETSDAGVVTETRPAPPPTPAPVEAVPPADVASPPPAAISPSSARATRVSDIRWSRRGEALVVRVVTDGPISGSSVARSRLAAPPREVLRLRGPMGAFPRATLAVDDELVRRIRTGLQSGGDLQIVFDVADATVIAADPRFLADGFELSFERRR